MKKKTKKTWKIDDFLSTLKCQSIMNRTCRKFAPMLKRMYIDICHGIKIDRKSRYESCNRWTSRFNRSISICWSARSFFDLSTSSCSCFKSILNFFSISLIFPLSSLTSCFNSTTSFESIPLPPGLDSLASWKK